MHILTTFAESTCTLNDKPISCDELYRKVEPFLGVGVAFLIVLVVLGIAVTVFWLMMLIHAIKHNSPDRTLWILILLGSWLFGAPLIAALVYYFVEKKKIDAPQPPASTPPEVQPPAQQG